ncbi:MAG: FtsW/RodA/SpoVE family cell cycle protein [Clostridia bacterium]|nr:FtsW/RodA/SpoVE family cell cycle protein [Clostridia bacterium]
MNKFSDSIKEFFKKTDAVLWMLTVLAIVYSFLLISSMQRSGEYNYMKTQAAAVLIGIVSAVVICAADYRFIIGKWYIAAVAAAGLAALVFIFGIQVEGTDDTAWISLPGGFTIQPSELIKICLIITFSKHLSYLKEKEMLHNPLGVATLVIHAAIPMAVIHIQGDDGTVLILALIFLIMSFVAGVRLRYFLILFGLIAAGIPIVWNYFMNEDQRNRFYALFDIDGNAMTNYGWQQYQGKVSIASGGLSGSGLYSGSRVEYGIVPEQENDFIFTVAGEELGFIGCIVLMGILLGIIIKVIINAKKAYDDEGKFICCGVFAVIASQTVINLGMVLGFLPVIGITLPLFSSGGTSALSTLICIGLVQSVRYHNDSDMDTAKIRRGSQNRIKI